MKKEIVKLKCGFDLEINKKNAKVSIIGLYNGYGELSDLKSFSELFTELHELGYKSLGLFRVEGYYDSTDDLILELIKK